MTKAIRHQCLLVSPSHGVHVERWLAALHDLGVQPVHLAQDDFDSNEDLLHILAKAQTETPVLVGPLDLAQELLPAVRNPLLLSWGFDLQEAADGVDLTRFAGVLVDSMANERIAREYGAREVLLLPWGTDLDTFAYSGPKTDLSKYGVTASESVVLSLRAHEGRYRIDDIIRAFAEQDRSARLVIGNTGSLTPELKALAAGLGVDAVFVPHMDEGDLPALLRRASVYVTASEVDGTSVTLLQAMSCGVPVVASQNAGNIEWIKEGETGFSFPVGDVSALNTALVAAMESGHRLTAAARQQVVERADWKRNILKLRPFLTKSQ